MMKTKLTQKLLFVAALCIAPYSIALAQDTTNAPSANSNNSAAPDTALIADDKNWYFSWGYSRQYYAPSNIHVTQPGLGNNFTVHQTQATDFATNIPGTIDSTLKFNFFAPQENIRIGKFMDAEKTFAIEFSLDHTKYNTNIGQTARVTGTLHNQPVNQNRVLDKNFFDYKLHNGLNHIMLNAVWLNHLYGPSQKPGDLQAISRVGAGILMPHADNTIDGHPNELGPKWVNSCCFASNDWWQIRGWTVGVEVGLRYRMTESLYLELTGKEAYGVLRKVAVYQGNADQELWLTEGVMSLGYLF
ncbi:MAG: hypothetical protein HOO97_02625 [Sideroxydans sp.]|nr:hypothetical protein [Sideroxydans sp.]